MARSSRRYRSFKRGAQLKNEQRQVERLARQKSRQQKLIMQQQKIRASLRRRIVIWTLVVLFGLLSIWISRINSVEIYTSDKNLSDYQETIDEYLNVGLNRFRPFFSSNELRDYISTQHPSLAKIDLSSRLFGPDLVLNLEGRQAVGQWVSSDQRLLVDSEGVVYRGQKLADHIRIIDDSGISVSPGDQVLDPQSIQYMLDTRFELAKLDLVMQSVTIESAPRQISVSLANKPYDLKLSTSRALSGQIDELKDVLKFIERRDIKINQYIDLRVEDRAFYQ